MKEMYFAPTFEDRGNVIAQTRGSSASTESEGALGGTKHVTGTLENNNSNTGSKDDGSSPG
jgi:hypothetical protein